MITQYVLNFFSAMIAGLVEVVNFSNDTINGVATGFVALLQDAGQNISALDPFIPVAAIVTSLTTAAGVVVAVIGVWVARFVISVFTGGGGSV